MSKMIRVESCRFCHVNLVSGCEVYEKEELRAFEAGENDKRFTILPNCPLEDWPGKKKFEDWYYTPESVEFEKSDEILPVKFAKLWKIAQGEK